MTIVPLIPRRRALNGLWQPDEMAQLLSIFAAHEAQGQATDWDTGETERREPQFYVLGDLAEQDCLVSITRIGRDYVLEDGQGHVVAEDSSLSAIADKAVGMSFACSTTRTPRPPPPASALMIIAPPCSDSKNVVSSSTLPA